MLKRYCPIFIVLLLTVFFAPKVNAQSNYIDSVLNWIKENPKVDSEYIVSLHRLSYRYNENDVKKSFEYYEKVSTLSDSLNFTYGKSLAQINLALLLSSAGNYEASNSAYFKAIDYAEACHALRLKAVAMNNIGENFGILKNLGKCREYTEKAIPLNTQLKAWRGVAINYELLQRCDLIEDKFANAKKNLDLGMPYALRLNENYILSQYYVGYGKLKAVENDIDSAQFYFKKAMSQAKYQNDLRNKYNVYRAKAKYLKNLSPSEKIVLLDSAYMLATKTHYLDGIAQAAELLSDEYELNNNKDSSLAYYRIYRSANDSLFSENNRRNILIKEADWMIKRKEIENAHLREISLIQKRDIVFKNILLAVTGALLLLILATSFFIYKNIQSKKKRTDAALKQKIAEIQMQSIRSQMNPHFIFNCLNSIENFIMRNEKLAASDYLNKFSELIRIMLESSRYDTIPFQKSMAAIILYLELEQLRFNNKFTYKFDVDPELINGDYKVPPLLMQPYVENAILHGISQSERESLQLHLSAYIDNGYIIYIVEDNGIGREQSSRYKKNNNPNHESLGNKLTQERIEIFNQQQNAEGGVTIMDLYNEKNEPNGTRVSVKIKAI